MAIGEGVGLHLVNTGVVKDNAMATTLTESLSYNDATALNQQASQTLLEGENPYAKSNIVNAAEKFKVPTTYLTPLKQGAFATVFPYPSEKQMDEALSKAEASTDTPPLEFESKVSYPAGSFLFQAPFVALGLKDTRWFYLMCAIAIVAVIFWKAPRRLRPVVIIAFLTNLVFWNLIGTGQTDTLYTVYTVRLDIQAATMALSLVYGACRNHQTNSLAFHIVLPYPDTPRDRLETRAAVAGGNRTYFHCHQSALHFQRSPSLDAGGTCTNFRPHVS
jgi:hypothetical protein